MDWRPGLPIDLETERFVLKSLVPKDATPTYVSWWNDPEVQKGLGFAARNWTQAQAREHIAKFKNTMNEHIGIFPKGEDLPIGFFTVFVESDGRVTTNTVIGNKDYWGKGVVLEIRETMLDFLFFTAKRFKVCGSVDARNTSMIYNYKKQGFTCEGILRQHTVAPDGTRHDQLQFGLLSEDWEAIRKSQAEKKTTVSQPADG